MRDDYEPTVLYISARRPSPSKLSSGVIQGLLSGYDSSSRFPFPPPSTRHLGMAAIIPHDPMRAYRAARDAARTPIRDKYNFIGFISSGTYGRVYKAVARESTDGQLFAIKKFKPDKEGELSYTGISQSACREIAVRASFTVHATY